MGRRAVLVLVSLFGTALSASPPPRHPPVALVDHVDPRLIAGSATDADVPGRAVTIHVYVDGRLFDSTIATPRFAYRHAPFGAGRHRIDIYALGVDAAGRFDGQNVRASGPDVDDFGCAPLAGDEYAFGWCRDMAPYWANRQRDTAPLFNRYVWIGVDNSYGGMIAQLYGEDRSVNLLQEHGGAALQLSLWGYEDLHQQTTDRFFRKTPPVNKICDPAPYETEAECVADGNQCAGTGKGGLRPIRGRQVTTCDNVCNGWEVAAPWNPIQAEGAQCSWDERVPGTPKAHNDVQRARPFRDEQGRPGWRIFYDTFSNFTKAKTIAGRRGPGTFPGLSVDQAVTLGDVYAKIQYTVRYARNAPYVLGRHPQEIPAIYTGRGIAVKAYRPGEPEQDVCDSSAGCEKSRLIPAAGSWWGVCDATGAKCLTVATLDNQTITRDSLARGRDGYGILTASTELALVPGFERTWTIYLFPYRYDRVIDGRSIEQRIAALRAR